MKFNLHPESFIEEFYSFPYLLYMYIIINQASNSFTQDQVFQYNCNIIYSLFQLAIYFQIKLKLK